MQRPRGENSTSLGGPRSWQGCQKGRETQGLSTGCRHVECHAPNIPTTTCRCFGAPPHDHRGGDQRPEEPPGQPSSASHRHGPALLSRVQGNKRLFHGKGRLHVHRAKAGMATSDRHWPRLCCPLSSTPLSLRSLRGTAAPHRASGEPLVKSTVAVSQ